MSYSQLEFAHKAKNRKKIIFFKLKTKTVMPRRNGAGNSRDCVSPGEVRESMVGRIYEEGWFKPGVKSEEVMDSESGESMEEDLPTKRI